MKYSRRPSSSEQAAQLEVLQQRIGTHGSRLWQLPFSYVGIIAIASGFAFEQGMLFERRALFGFLAVQAILVGFCMLGSVEGYVRTARNMSSLESNMRLLKATSAHWMHIVPYFAILVAAGLWCVCIAFDGFGLCGAHI